MKAASRQAPRIYIGLAVLIQLGLLFTLAIAWRILGQSYDAKTLIYPMCLCVVGLFVWSLVSWRILVNRLFDPYIIFLIAAYIFNGGTAFLEVFGLNKDGVLGSPFSDETTFETLYIVILALTALHLGALVSALIRRRPQPPSPGKKQLPLAELSRGMRLVGWFFLLLSLLPTIITLKNSVTVSLDAGYSAIYEQTADVGIAAIPYLLGQFIVPAALFILAGSEKRPVHVFIGGLVVVSYSILQITLVGLRGMGVLPLIAFVWLWHRAIHRIPVGILVGVSAIVLFIVFPVIGTTRDEASADRLSLTTLTDAFNSLDNPAVASVAEMGGTIRTVAYTLELVPSTRDYDMGMSYLYAFSTLAPNVFGSIHPAKQYGLPGDWLISVVDPYTAARGGGLGYSFIAEAYLNFGLIGTPLTIFIIGLLFGMFVFWGDKSGEPAKLAMLASFLSFFPFLARAQIQNVLRPFFWYALIPYCCVYLAAKSPYVQGVSGNLRAVLKRQMNRSHIA